MTTEQRNNAICAYMGGPDYLKQTHFSYIAEDKQFDMIGPSDLRFHESWDWLIPVWSKVRFEMKSVPAFSLHLFILSDDEIKQGDYWFNLDTDTWHNGDNWNLAKNAPSCKKIIATTYPFPATLIPPSPSFGFLEKYSEKYNNKLDGVRQTITEVHVEYHQPNDSDGDGNYSTECKSNGCTCWVPKINRKDDTITIRKIKETFTRDEVTKLLHEYREFCWRNGVTVGDLNNWIKDNV